MKPGHGEVRGATRRGGEPLEGKNEKKRGTKNVTRGEKPLRNPVGAPSPRGEEEN